MVPASLFAIESAAQNKKLTSKVEVLREVLKTDLDQNIYDSEMRSKLKGWPQALIEKLDKCELTQVWQVNKPVNMYEENFKLFLLADYMKPGLHKKVIYYHGQYWSAEFLVDQNTRDFYPDYK